jgi:hypothetical protein
MHVRILLALALSVTLLPFGAVSAAQEQADRSGLEFACPEGEVPDSGFTDTEGNPHEHAIECASLAGTQAVCKPVVDAAVDGIERGMRRIDRDSRVEGAE